MTPQERASIRAQLRVRRLLDGTYEVYTTVHGSGVFRWIKVTKDIAEWYRDTFQLDYQNHWNDVNMSTGELKQAQPMPPY